jgi:hypothetical protein
MTLVSPRASRGPSRCHTARAAAAALAVCLLSFAARGAAEPSCTMNINKKIHICENKPYALCDKATCKPTPSPLYVQCTCQVLTGNSIADLSQTNGTCIPSQPSSVYSFFSLDGFHLKDQLTCPDGSTWAQCWNAPCTLLAGGKQATCNCPSCTSSFVTPGGNCNPNNCKQQILVGSPFPVSGGGGCPGSR